MPAVRPGIKLAIRFFCCWQTACHRSNSTTRPWPNSQGCRGRDNLILYDDTIKLLWGSLPQTSILREAAWSIPSCPWVAPSHLAEPAYQPDQPHSFVRGFTDDFRIVFIRLVSRRACRYKEVMMAMLFAAFKEALSSGWRAAKPCGLPHATATMSGQGFAILSGRSGRRVSRERQ